MSDGAANSLGLQSPRSSETDCDGRSSPEVFCDVGRGAAATEHLDVHYRTLGAESARRRAAGSRRARGIPIYAGAMASSPEPVPSPENTDPQRPVVLAVWLVVAGVIGWFAAFELTLEKFNALTNPGSGAACDLSPLVQCSANLESWQGSVFGFPNPILGLTGWVAPIVVGVALLAGARFARWFWWLFAAGVTFAFGFVIWLISQSIFDLHTLCPWCMVTWLVTIPTFYAVWVHLLRTGVISRSDRARAVGAQLATWVPLMAIVSYAIVLLLAQLELNAVPYLLDVFF